MPNKWWNRIGQVLIQLGLITLIGDDRRYIAALLRIGFQFAEAQPTAFEMAMRGTKIEFPAERKGPEAQLQLPLE